MDKERLRKTIEEINQFSNGDKGINRLAYSPELQAANRYLIDLFKKENLTVRVDEAGNIIARREGLNPNLPVVACGSHIDSVYQGGKYDGVVGVCAALEVIRTLNQENLQTEHPIEIICFAAEESARFGISTIGSKAMAGFITEDEIKFHKDKNGITLEEAFESIGLSVALLDKCKRNSDEFKAFYEMHIEQGPVLERTGTQIGIVNKIAAPTRMQIHIQGKGSHSGTTPMNYRKDALVQASKIVLEIERLAISEASNGTVATVGVFEVSPGAMNVIPDSVDLKVDIRGTSKDSIEQLLKSLIGYINFLSQENKMLISYTITSQEEPVELDKDLVVSVMESCEQLGLSYQVMNSGAGHDSMNLAKLCPTSLIFIPCQGGLSHHPDEYVSIDEIAVGMSLLKEEILKSAIVQTAGLTTSR